MRNLLTLLLILLVGTCYSQSQAGCVVTFPTNFDSNYNFSTFDQSQCDPLDVIFNNVSSKPDGSGNITFDDDNVTINSLTVNFRDGQKPAELIIPAGKTLTITNDLVFTGVVDKDKFLTINGNLSVGGTLDLGDVQFEIDGTGTISADKITGGGDTSCSGAQAEGTCPSITANSCDGGGICNDGNFTLPIELKSFTASIKFDNVQLDWVTAKEENFSHFEVERTLDNTNYEPIAFIQGVGESLSDVTYEFVDDNAPYGVIYYRLKSVDNDGSFEYSWIISIKKSLEGKVNVSPNPASATEKIKVNLPGQFEGEIAVIGIYDLNGTLIQQLLDVDAQEPLKINSDLKAGMYLIKIQHNGLEENMRLLIR